MSQSHTRPDPEEVLLIEGLDVRLAGLEQTVPILDGINLNIKRGETLCLVGESGSGKSVTSLAIMGLLPTGLQATNGSVRLLGDELMGSTARKMRSLRGSRVAMIFQEPMTALNPVLRVGDQIAEVLALHSDLAKAEIDARVQQIAEQVRLPDPDRILQSYPHELSGGQRQRVMIAMALVLEPALLIADEPTTALDVTTQRQILSLIAELKERLGTAVLFITHDMGVVAEIADTVAVMRDGRIVEHAPVDQLLRHPQEEYTRQLLKAVPGLTPRPPRTFGGQAKVLEVRSLCKVYGGGGFFRKRQETLAATDVSFDLLRGQTVGIVGESGSGKSTVARCVLRLVDPSAGEILLDGSDITTLAATPLRPHRRKMQIVFQDPNRSLNPRWTVGRSLVEGPVNFGVKRSQAEAEARRLLDVVGLPQDAMTRYPHQFSGGQRQRIAIARAVTMGPDVLVADEAVSALDVSVQAQVIELLTTLQADLGIGILFITHDLRVAAQICDQVIVMQGGRIVEQGPAGELLADPRHPYTRELIEAAPGRDWDFRNFRRRAQVL